MSSEANANRKRPQNCFRCWHSRRVEGMSNCCVCVAHMSKHVKPEFIEEPYRGICLSFYDKSLVEAEFIRKDDEDW